jgi:hypothetical protein
MGLIGGMARTAVIAGTATAVSNRVSRRQARRWQQQADDQYDNTQQQDQNAQPQYAQQQYQQGPPAAPAAGGDGTTAELERLAALKNQGALSDEEFAAAKKKLLGL